MPLIALEQAVQRIGDQQAVAFATETVFGLGANAYSDPAVAKIYEIKGRPSFNPLIVHYVNADGPMRDDVVWTPQAEALAKQFWPGPLTIILLRSDNSRISPLCSAGGPTVAVRVPATLSARQFIQACGVPLAAPSANTSGKISPTRADHVLGDLGPAFPVLMAPEQCQVGLESSVVDLSGNTPCLLRPGAISQDDLALCLGEDVFCPSQTKTKENTKAPLESRLKSPGMLSSHYAPDKPVRLNAAKAANDEVFVGFGDDGAADLSLSPSGNLTEAASRLFSILHQANKHPKPKIAFATIPEQGIGIAINDRLKRAAAPKT